MAPTFLSAIKESKGPILGCVVTIASPITGQIVARSGCTWCMIDMEHSPLAAEQTTRLVHSIIAASAGQCVPIVRIPSHGVEWVKWALDSGAAGIIIPMVNTKKEAEDIINRAVYPPGGARSYGPFNAPYADLDPKATAATYFAKAKDIAIIPILESKQGLENAEEILSVKGITGAFVGPNDLRLSLGLSAGRDGPEPLFVDALKKIMEVGKRLGKPIGSMGVGQEVARKRTEIGMDFLLCTLDASALATGLADDINAATHGGAGSTKL
jgi:4-hydroxy-2-oxoheptanedioate aldolase